MIQAELHNKCKGEDLRRSEDGLTSTVFGILQYQEFSDILKDFLGCARNIHNNKKKLPNLKLLTQNNKFYFWHRFRNNKEIDLLISTDDEQIGIEVKYDSGESSEEQLSNYINALNGSPLIFITMMAPFLFLLPLSSFIFVI